jgi:hypothetical protein
MNQQSAAQQRDPETKLPHCRVNAATPALRSLAPSLPSSEKITTAVSTWRVICPAATALAVNAIWGPRPWFARAAEGCARPRAPRDHQIERRDSEAIGVMVTRAARLVTAFGVRLRVCGAWCRHGALPCRSRRARISDWRATRSPFEASASPRCSQGRVLRNRSAALGAAIDSGAEHLEGRAVIARWLTIFSRR